MKNLSILLQEKLKINSKSKITDDISDWCIAMPKGDLFKVFSKEFEDYKYEMIIEGGILTVYIIQSKELEKYIDNPDLFLYKIPDNFDNIDDFKMALTKRESPEFDWDELKDWQPV